MIRWLGPGDPFPAVDAALTEPNGLLAAGGELTTAGSASLSNDTLILAGSGMTPSSSALYFQGTTMQHAQIVYGDGLRCVTGNVVRLGTKTNAGGTSDYPAVGDPSVSVRGGVMAPGTRYYQVSYRDLGNFCTPAPFNINRPDGGGGTVTVKTGSQLQLKGTRTSLEGSAQTEIKGGALCTVQAALVKLN